MFSSALKSFSSNITSSYSIAPQPSSTSGPWKIFDAKRKSSGKAASIFVFDRSVLSPHGSSANAGLSAGGKTGSQSLRRGQEEVIDRLKREASSLAKLRHPSILELAEPVEETRNGGLMFATEAVVGSLASLLAEQDEVKSSSGRSERKSRFRVEATEDGPNASRELELNELEIQKGLLQLGKGLEFLHESAGLVHANLTPEAVIVNAKGDWKISGLAFCGPHETSTAATSLIAISLAEVLNHDPRLPRSVQMNLDYTSPDFILDNSLTPSADMFSLGLIIIALYNTPHISPLQCNTSISAYKRLFASSASIPTQNNNFLVPTSTSLPATLSTTLLPRLITRRPAQRLTAHEFQQSPYFDNLLVSTLRFIDALPGKSAAEKAQFMRGLPKVLPQFPASVLEKKVLPALLEEMKERELLAPGLANIFAAIKGMKGERGRKCFGLVVVPRLREIFIASTSKSVPAAERDTGKDAGLMVLLENMQLVASLCVGKEFHQDILPIIVLALESPTHAIVDAALGTLQHILTALDFSTIKNELFPVVAGVFSKTSSLNIKIKGLEAFYILCGGSSSNLAIPASKVAENDDLSGFHTTATTRKATTTTTNSSAILDKHTIQSQIVPLLRAIKTKEPAVMMACLRVFRQVAEVADSEFLAMEVLPVMWSMSLGPLLDLGEFQGFMELIRAIGAKIEGEQVRKLRDLRGDAGSGFGTRSGLAGSRRNGAVNGVGAGGQELDFESLVTGRQSGDGSLNDDLTNGWHTSTAPAVSDVSTRPGVTGTRTQSAQPPALASPPAFTLQTPALRPSSSSASQPFQFLNPTLRAQVQNPISRAITPDQPLSNFTPLMPTPSTAATASSYLRPSQPTQPSQSSARLGTGIDWSAAAAKSGTINQWSSPAHVGTAFSQMPTMNGSSVGSKSMQLQNGGISFGLASMPTQVSQQSTVLTGSGLQQSINNGTIPPRQGGLDKYESLL